MSTKSKTAMDANEGETNNVKVRPTRNVKPVSYKENTTSKRGQASSELIDKKKKKVNGSSGDDASTKKPSKKKADAVNEDNIVEDELLPESGKQSEEKPVVKKPISRKKKAEATAVDEDSADENINLEVVEVTNGSSKPTESKAKTVAKGKKAEASKPATTKTSKIKKVTKEPTDVEAEIDGENSPDDEPAKPVAVVAPKQKTGKGKKGAKEANDVEAEIDGQDEVIVKPLAVVAPKQKTAKGKKGAKEANEAEIDVQDSPEEEPAKSTSSKPATTKTVKSKKATKETNDAVDDTEEASTKTTKGRGKKAVTAKDSQPRTAKRKASTSIPDTVITPKITESKSRAVKRKAVDPVPSKVITPKITKKNLSTKTTNKQTATVVVKASEDFYSPDVEWSMKISSWNVAGFRSLLKKNGLEFVEKESPDIFCLQETKCMEDEIPPEGNITGYHRYCLGMKGGHAGVALYTKIMPYELTYGIGDPEMDLEARLITAEYTKFYLLCVYVPNSGRKLVNLNKRMEWDRKFQDYITQLDKKKPVIICGDMNVAHLEIDLTNPKTNKRNAGFTIEERQGMSDMLAKGFIDTYRDLYPDRTNTYTFWTYMANAREKNVGWRLDYFITSERLKKNVVDNIIRSSVFGSDHCPITLFLKF